MDEKEKIIKLKNSTHYKKVEKSIKKYLKVDKNTSEYLIDLIRDYMKLYVVKELAHEDIRERGTVVEWHNGKQQGLKKNDSVDIVLKTNQQMLQLLKAMGVNLISDMGIDDFEM